MGFFSLSMEKRSCLFALAFVGEFMLKFIYSLPNLSKEMLTAKNASPQGRRQPRKSGVEK